MVKAKKLNIERFSGQINWQRSDDYNWQMIGQQLQLTLDKRALPPAQFGIKVYERENDASWQLLVLKNLQLHSLTSLLQFSKIVQIRSSYGGNVYKLMVSSNNCNYCIKVLGNRLK